ncbi:hypothetical protein DYH09_10040 [bacterium CPR1]|nr:hypothetical protein [bacterium CPR1]
MKKNLLVAFALALVFVAGRATADQPRMQAAQVNLLQARENLRAATPDKGGHRTKALVLVNKALEQVQLGIAWDRKH